MLSSGLARPVHTGPKEKADATPRTTLQLSRQYPDAKNRLLYSRRTRIILIPAEDETTPEKPLDLSAFPELKSHYFGSLPLHEAAGGPLRLAFCKRDPASPCPDTILLDVDRNQRIGPDEPSLPLPFSLVPGRSSGEDRIYSRLLLDVPLDFSPPGPSSTTEAPAEERSFSLICWWSLEGEPISIRVHRVDWREGTGSLDGEPLRILVVDDDNNGVVEVGPHDSWNVISPDASPKERFASEGFLPLSQPHRYHGKIVSVEQLDSLGNTITVRSAPPNLDHEGPPDPSPEEQSRPRTKNRIPWLSIDEGIPKAFEEEKTLLVVFFDPEDPNCRALETRAFSDREVVELASNFICCRLRDGTDSGFAKAKQVTKCPTVLVISATGHEQIREEGFLTPKQFANLLRRAVGKQKKIGN